MQCAVAVLICVGCGNLVEQTKSDLDKYPVMKPFFAFAGEFVRGHADLDVGCSYMVFRLPTTMPSATFFSLLNQTVEQHGWKPEERTTEEWRYDKVERMPTGKSVQYGVYVKHRSNSLEVEVNWTQRLAGDGS
jgi:hypothetical protein